MPTNILMPALSPTMEKGNLAKWLKKEGDKVKSGDVIAEIETDKATMEYEAVDEGTLAKIVVPEGTQDVAVNAVIAVLAGEGEDVKAAASTAKAAPAPATKAAEAPKPATKAEVSKAPAPAPQAATPKPAAAPMPQPVAASGSNRIFSSPLARRLAKEAGIDLGRVQGSGPHGRVIARDIEQAKSGEGLRAAPSIGAPSGAPSPQTMSDQQVRALYEEGSYDFVPHDGMRRTIAQRLTASTQIDSAFLSDGRLRHRQAHGRARGDQRRGAARTKTASRPTSSRSTTSSSRRWRWPCNRCPNANVSWTDAGMLKHKHSDVGVAVALPGGLITPIIRNAETKSLSAISNEMKELAGRARAGKLKPHEYQGGTSSVSNLGMFGIKDFTAVINPPQSTILAVGTGEERAVVRNGQLAVATLMSVTLSCDHRAVDGALGAELISAFKRLIENPVMMVV